MKAARGSESCCGHVCGRRDYWWREQWIQGFQSREKAVSHPGFRADGKKVEYCSSMRVLRTGVHATVKLAFLPRAWINEILQLRLSGDTIRLSADSTWMTTCREKVRFASTRARARAMAMAMAMAMAAAAAAARRRVCSSVTRLLPIPCAHQSQSPPYALRQTRPVYVPARPEKDEDTRLDQLITAMQRVERSLKSKDTHSDGHHREYEKRFSKLEARVSVLLALVGTMFAYSLTHPALVKEVEDAHNDTRSRVDVLEMKARAAARKSKLKKSP